MTLKGEKEAIEFLHSGDRFLEKVIELIENAKESITLESYIFAPDKMGLRIIQALASASKRGVKIRTLIDGVGSSQYLVSLQALFAEDHLPLRVFNPMPTWTLFGLIQTDLSPGSPMPALLRSGFWRTLSKLNRRNHRKVIIADHAHAIVGGMNIKDVTCESVWGSKAWRDSSVYIRSNEVKVLCAAFDRAWTRAPQLGWSVKLSAPHDNHSAEELKFETTTILINDPSSHRRETMRQFFSRLHHAKRRIYFVTPYFVPTRRLLKTLISAVERGVDTRIIVPQKSDVRIADFLANSYLHFLWSKGVTIFRYQKSVLHAKYSIIDDVASIGSGNLNHRSLIHDLEVEVLFPAHQGMTELVDQWSIDLSYSKPILTRDAFAQGFFVRILSRMLFWVRYYL